MKLAMTRRGNTLGQDVSRRQVAEVAKCSVQNIGMILNNARGVDQKLGVESHEAVAEFLRVNSRWLLAGEGPIDPLPRNVAPIELSAAAIEIAALFDLIPAAEKIKRAQAYNAATTAILQVLQS